ncbi:MAG: DoxX family membrane protein [Candidatus Kapabacteria bacterium]|nr:DoxX family membrane protein [Candidatus Kapabacteria bacterium]
MISKILYNPYLQLIARLAIGVLFIFAAIGKIAEPAQFAKEISNYRLVWEPLLNIIALIMPWIELIIGLFILVGFRLRSSSALASILLMIFIVAVGLAMIQGLSINCGCFAKNMAETVGWKKIAENTLSILVCFYIFKYPIQKLSLEQFVQSN